MTDLYIMDGHDNRKALEFRVDSLVVGRSADSDVRIKEGIHRVREGVEDQRLSTEVLEHVMHLKEAFMVSDVETEKDENVPDTLKLLHIKSVICVPLFVQ